VLGVGLFLVVPACASDESSVDPDGSPQPSVTAAGASATAMTVPRALLEAEGWRFREAFDIPEDGPLAGLEPVPSAWAAEYEQIEQGGDTTVSRLLTLTGVRADLERYRAEVEALGFSFVEVATPFGTGLVGTSVDPGGPEVVAVPLGDATLQLLAYELEGDQIRELLVDVHKVDDAEWLAAGGTIGAVGPRPG